MCLVGLDDIPWSRFACCLSGHQFQQSTKPGGGSVGRHWLGVFFVSLVLGSVELGNFALCLLGIIYGFFVAFWVWIMNFNNKESLVCSLLVMLRWVGCFWLEVFFISVVFSSVA